MARYAHNIHHVYIADGFFSDCDELIHRCLKLQNLQYQSFCNIWKDLNFGMIYQGRSSGAEIAELSEEVIYIAKHYMIKDTTNFEESVAGLFLVYGILTLQPFSGFACLRLVPEDIPAINRIEVVARRERRLDILFILGEILVKYTQYHVAERDRGMESVLRKYLEGFTSIDRLGVRPRGVFYRQNDELDVIRDVGSLLRQYIRAKNSLTGPGKQDAGLQYINENLATELSTSLKRVINGVIDNEKDDDDDDDDDGDEDHYNAVQAIKNKAMTNTVNSIKHLTRIEERTMAKESPKKKSDLKDAIGKIKTGSPTKPVTTPRKRKAEPKTRKKKCKEAPKPRETTDVADNIDIDLDAFQKGVFVDNIAEEFGMEIVNQKNLKIEDLPETSQTESKGRLIEIEIIDETKKTNINENESTGQSSQDSGTKCEDAKPTSGANKKSKSIKRKRRDDMPVEIHSFGIPGPNKTRTKTPRDLKRTKLKSKFKRMGMLPVANFNEPK
ncbi:uncharacterized protein LOC126777067 isoform X1 [Nymphalis io]|uniref:uncharacterized protein LOC126777067 isoform X1 n=1 Tax=Inachis io TaxID=171585 RepID=UPI0021680279|nr:uncharacterized protein LOC126777067 isoform X1 [Nymphalis io]